MHEPDERGAEHPPGPTNWVKIRSASSSGSNGGKPPEMTTVSERTMNSMPSVVMKLGIAKVSVMNPLRKPIAAAIESPSTTPRDGTPAMISSEVTIGVSANVEPTERSNSPQIIRMVTPIETSPTSGSRPEYSAQVVSRQEGAARARSNRAASNMSSATPASSGFSR